ncbi:hypothetical protein LINPERPRIM_LOCUS42625, partial [Linum perenne]
SARHLRGEAFGEQVPGRRLLQPRRSEPPPVYAVPGRSDWEGVHDQE